VVRVPGARSDLKRTATFQTPGGTTIRIPDIASALSLKGAAYHTPSANPERHLQDAITLFACAALLLVASGRQLAGMTAVTAETRKKSSFAAASDPEAAVYATMRRSVPATLKTSQSSSTSPTTSFRTTFRSD
jgi:hypothetical protein